MITFPRLLSDLLIFFVSRRRSPVDPDCERRSLPARSTRLRVPLDQREGGRKKNMIKDLLIFFVSRRWSPVDPDCERRSLSLPARSTGFRVPLDSKMEKDMIKDLIELFRNS